MAPQDKARHLADKGMSLKQHDFVADSEQKLVTARQLFSLHEYPRCQELVVQILEADPCNSQAKALLELTAIKLSRRNVDKDIVGSQLANETRPQASILELKEKGSLPESNNAELNNPRLACSPHIMRERTISALVQFFKQKDQALEDWRDPRFRPQPALTQKLEEEPGQARSKSSTEYKNPPSSLPHKEVEEEIRQEKEHFFTRPLTEPFKSVEEQAAKPPSKSTQQVPKAKLNVLDSVELVQLPQSQQKSTHKLQRISKTLNSFRICQNIADAAALAGAREAFLVPSGDPVEAAR